MAITNGGVKVSLASNYIPTGYVLPTATEVTGPEMYVNLTSVTILKSAVENANAVTAFTALVAAVNVASAALVTLYFNAAEDIDFYTDFITLDGNNCVGEEESAYTTDAEEYTCGIVQYVQAVEIT